MKYRIRIFKEHEDIAFTQYEFDSIPYMPRIGETITIYDVPYLVSNIVSSFERMPSYYLVDYFVKEMVW